MMDEMDETQPEIRGKINLSLKLEDRDTANSTQVNFLLNSDSKLDVVKQTTQAALRALVAMGYVEADEVELDTKVSTTAIRTKYGEPHERGLT